MRSTLKVREVAQGDEALILSTGFAVFRPLPGVLEPSYLRHWLRSPGLQAEKDRLCTGAVQPAITNGGLEELKISLLPIEEQRRIAAVLDAADNLRVKRREVLAKLGTLNEAIFMDMFGDPLANTMGWPKRSFADLCPTTLGKMLDKKQQTGLHLRPYLRNANVRWFGFDLTDLHEMDFDTQARQKYRLKVGDVLICEGGEPGRAAVWREETVECYFQKALHRGRPDPKLATSDFIVHLLYHLARTGGLLDHISTATIAHLTGKRLKEMEVIAPPLTIQEEFCRRLAAVEAEKLTMTQSESRLAALAASLQQRAFRGKL